MFLVLLDHFLRVSEFFHFVTSTSILYIVHHVDVTVYLICHLTKKHTEATQACSIHAFPKN